MSFDSSSMDLGLRLASCLCEVGRGTFVSDNWGTNMRKMGFGRSRISLLPKGCTKWIMTCGKVMNLIFVEYPEDSLGCCGTPWGREVSPFMPRLAAGEPEVFDLIILMDKNPPPVDMENIPVFLGFYNVLYRWCRIPSINSDITKLCRWWVIQWQAPLTHQSIWFYYVSNKWNLWTKTSWYGCFRK